MSASQNIATFQRFIEEGLNQKKVLAISSEICNANLVLEAPGIPLIDGRTKGFEIFKVFTSTFTDSFPDLKVSLAHSIVEGEVGAFDLPYEGTHAKDFAGVPATNKYVKGGEIWMVHFAGGKMSHIRISEYGTPLRALLLGDS